MQRGGNFQSTVYQLYDKFRYFNKIFQLLMILIAELEDILTLQDAPTRDPTPTSQNYRENK